MFILTDNSGKILYQCKYKQIGFVKVLNLVAHQLTVQNDTVYTRHWDF